MFSKKSLKSLVLCSAIALSALATPVLASPPAAGGGYNQTAAFNVWMEFVRAIAFNHGLGSN